MAFEQFDYTIVYGSFACITTFVIVLVSYIFLFKQRREATVEELKAKTGTPDTEPQRQTHAVSNQVAESTNVDKKNGEPDRTLPGPIGMCPFSANKDQKLNKGEPDGKLPKPMCAFSALGAMMGGGALPTMPIPKKPSESVYEHIPAKIKRAEKEQLQKEIESEMTEEDKAREREVTQEQMKQIFEMMAQNEHTFGTATNNDVHQQMKLYM